MAETGRLDAGILRKHLLGRRAAKLVLAADEEKVSGFRHDVPMDIIQYGMQRMLRIFWGAEENTVRKV